MWMRSSLMWMRSSLMWMRSSLMWMRSSLMWMRSSSMWMRSSLMWMRSSPMWMRSSLMWMRSSLMWMRSSLVVRASDCQCRSRNSHGFDRSQHPPTQWHLRAADEAVLNTVQYIDKKIPLLFKLRIAAPAPFYLPQTWRLCELWCPPPPTHPPALLSRYSISLIVSQSGNALFNEWLSLI